MKLEKGMYVRTNKGYIGKLKNHYLDSITESNEYVFENGYGFCEADYEYITKHSNNLIDLIEVGDYVNGKLIHKIQIKNDGTKLLEYGNGNHIKIIKEILTHEQYKANVYELEGDTDE